MIIKRQDLMQQHGESLEIAENLTFDLSQVKQSVLKDLKNVFVSGHINYDDSTFLAYLFLNITADMVLPDSITNEDVVVELDTDVNEVISFKPISEEEQEDILVVKGDTLNLYPLIFTHILSEVPLSVSTPGQKVYPKGEGWEVLNEADFEAKDKELDPRLAKLKEFKFED